MKWMECTTCHGIVEVNNTGICLGCQKGFTHILQSDIYSPHQKNEIIEEKYALQKRISKKVSVRHKTTNSAGIRQKNSPRKKTSPQNEKKKEK